MTTQYSKERKEAIINKMLPPTSMSCSGLIKLYKMIGVIITPLIKRYRPMSKRKAYTTEFKHEAASLVLDQSSLYKRPVRLWGLV
jgi:hypothetical protein